MVGRELESYYHKRELGLGAPLLEVEDLHVPGAREPVSFTARAGEVVGFAGLVGAGRTETTTVRRGSASRPTAASAPAGSVAPMSSTGHQRSGTARD